MAKMTNDRIFWATNKNMSNQEKSCIDISVPMQDSFLFKAMQESHEQQKTKIDI
jgi:hypothetical protein